MIKLFSVFTGIGSLEMAFKNTDISFELVGTSEVDKYAILAYSAIHSSGQIADDDLLLEEIKKEILDKNIAYNFSTGKSEIPRNERDLRALYKAHVSNKNYGDIRRIDETELPDFNFFSYSFPCKNISIAGDQEGFEKGSGTQSGLLWECERIIKHKRPQYLLMENVKNLVSKKHMPFFQEWINYLYSIGYNSYWQVLNAKDYGLPQNRERVIMISKLKEKDFGYSFPPKKPLNINVNSLLEGEGEIDEALFYSAKRVSHIRFGGNRETNKLHHIGNVDNKKHANCRVYDPNGLSPTLNSMNGGNRQPKFKTITGVRRATARECWRLMGYKDLCFERAKNAGIPKSKLYERSGRGIAVPMLEEVVKSLFEQKQMEFICQYTS